MPLWHQYLNFWGALLQGDLGISVWLFPQPVTDVILSAIPYTLALLIPAILLSWCAGNRFGAYAARRKWLDNTVLPLGYILTATPYMWLGILLAWALGVGAGMVPDRRAATASRWRPPGRRSSWRAWPALVPAVPVAVPGRASAAGRSACAT